MECESDKAWENTFNNNIPSLDTRTEKREATEKLFSLKGNTSKIRELSTEECFSKQCGGAGVFQWMSVVWKINSV